MTGIKSKKGEPMIQCLYEDKIKDMHKIITGNGHPEDGMIVKMANLQSGQKEISDSLLEMTRVLGNIQLKQDGLLEEITDVHGKLLRFKTEVETTDKVSKSHKEGFFKTAGLILAAVGLCVTIFFSLKGLRKDINSKDIVIEQTQQAIRLNQELIKKNQESILKNQGIIENVVPNTK